MNDKTLKVFEDAAKLREELMEKDNKLLKFIIENCDYEIKNDSVFTVKEFHSTLSDMSYIKYDTITNRFKSNSSGAIAWYYALSGMSLNNFLEGKERIFRISDEILKRLGVFE